MMKEATYTDQADLVSLASLLWPKHRKEALLQEIIAYLENSDAVLFLAYEESKAIGFAICQMRMDYVEGTHLSPVGYLEGLFTKEAYRKQGYAQQLVHACEKWAKERGCQEFASDCELDNKESLLVHQKLGFMEANRIICFTKHL